MTIDPSRRRFVMQLSAAAFMATGPGMAIGQVVKNIADQPWTKAPEGAQPVRGGTLRLAASTYIGKMNPNHWPVTDWATMGYFVEKFLVTDGSYRPTVPWLAESVVLEDPTTVLMTLRRGVVFHDGAEFDAEAVKYQIDWLLGDDSGAWSISMVQPLASVEVVDPYTLRWRFEHSWGAFKGVMANVPGYALSPEALEKGNFDTEPQGTGPYIMVEGKPANYVRLKRNPNWWFAQLTGRTDLPYFDEIRVSVIPNPAVRLASLQAGELDMLVLDKSQYDEVRNNPNFNVYRQPLNTSTGLRLNSANGPFTDVRLRKAINHAIPRGPLIEGTQHGIGREASGLYPDNHWAHNHDLAPNRYDPQLARELLAEAGYPNGLTVRGFFGNTAPAQTLAQALKGILAQVGIRWEVELLAPTAATARLRAEDFDLATGGWPYIYDPDLAATGLYHPNGSFAEGRREDPERTQMIEAARVEPDGEHRQQMYRELEKYLAEDYLDVWLWWEETVEAHNVRIKGWDNDMFLQYKEAYASTLPMWFADGGASQ